MRNTEEKQNYGFCQVMKNCVNQFINFRSQRKLWFDKKLERL